MNTIIQFSVHFGHGKLKCSENVFIFGLKTEGLHKLEKFGRDSLSLQNVSIFSPKLSALAAHAQNV